MLSALLVLGGIGLVLGGVLGWASVKFRVEDDPLVEKIDAILPQTQCGQCGFPGCKPYAEAIAKGEAPINQCPPGGADGVKRLAELLGVDPPASDNMEHQPKTVAVIDENTCIGCTLCIQACPVDAIVGASKQLHAIIEKQCTGCELCLPPCPVDCIHMVVVKESLGTWKWRYPVHALRRVA